MLSNKPELDLHSLLTLLPQISIWPCWLGNRPVRIDARLGEQAGLQLKALVNIVPSLARASILGVRTSVLP